MADFWAFAWRGVVVAVLGALYLSSAVACCTIPAYLASTIDFHWLLAYLVSLPLLGFISGGLVFFLDWISA